MTQNHVRLKTLQYTIGRDPFGPFSRVSIWSWPPLTLCPMVSSRGSWKSTPIFWAFSSCSAVFKARPLKFWHKTPLEYVKEWCIFQMDRRNLPFLPPGAQSEGFWGQKRVPSGQWGSLLNHPKWVLNLSPHKMRFVWAIWGPPKSSGTVPETPEQYWVLADFGEKTVKSQLAPISTKLKRTKYPWTGRVVPKS